jgi:feruloyl-CoA synthase
VVDLNKAEFRELSCIPRDVEVVTRDDGVITMRCRVPLNIREPNLPAYLRRHAKARPDARFISQRLPGGGDWRSVTYHEARELVDNLTQALLDLKLPSGSSLIILSGNSIEHAMIALAAMQASIPVAPLSPAYALQSADFSKLREMLAAVKAGAVFVQSGADYARALDALHLGDTPVITVSAPRAGRSDLQYAELAKRPAGPDVERAYAAIDPNAPAKFMFTSGSTGSPKAVPQTQRNLGVALESNHTTFGQTEEGTFVRLDWTPWSHVFGASGLGLALTGGGSYYIDDGRPGTPLYAETLRNLREVCPSTYVSVPAGYTALVQALEADESFAKTFFGSLQYLGYGGARLPDDLARRLHELSVKYTGYKAFITCGYGATETGPGGAFVYWPTDRVGFVGLPHPGYELKLVPIDDTRYEVRIRSEAVMAGYHGRPDLNAQVFDEDGFYRIGDAATFLEQANPLEGLVFAGRLSDEFKLQTGTFVLAGALRAAFIDAAAPLLHEVVVCGENEAYVSVLAWINVEAARAAVGQPDATREQLNAHPEVRRRISEAFAAHNQRAPGSSTRVVRFHLLDEPPSIDKGELTDKGSINQRAVQRNRPSLTAALFEPAPSASVVVVDQAAFAREKA